MEEIVTKKLSLLLDGCSISDREAVMIISAAEALDHDPLNLTVSRSVIRLGRQQFRKRRTEFIKSRFKNSESERAIVQWDGKLLLDIFSKENVEIVVDLISCEDEEQSIGVSQLEKIMGITEVKFVFQRMNNGLVGKIQTMCTFPIFS